MDLVLVEFSILVCVVVFEDPLSVFLDLMLDVTKSVRLDVIGISLIITFRIGIWNFSSLIVPLRIVI